MQYSTFVEINLHDPFFDSLKADYAEFEQWYNAKAATGATALIVKGATGIQGFLYLKTENEELSDIIPPLLAKKRAKVGTLKVNPHGTRLGERFIKKIFDYATVNEAEEIYVTIFSRHEALINLFFRYGFVKHGTKVSGNGMEDVLLKSLTTIKGSVLGDYPLIKLSHARKFLLSIYPEFHSRLFPDSLLNNETFDVIKDVSHTNSIHKIYVCYMDLSDLSSGDNVVIYRTGDGRGPAYHRAVATSIAVVEEVKTIADFADLEDYLNYCKDYSVFTSEELTKYFNSGSSRFFVVKMTYNAAFTKRVNRARLLNEVGLDAGAYFGFLKLTDVQFKHILDLGGVSESIIID